MNQKSKKELTILIALLALLSVSVFSQFSGNQPSSVVSSNPRLNAGERVAVQEVLNLDSLSNEVPEFSGVKRNIFQFGAVARDPNPPIIAVPEVEPEEAEVPAFPEVHYLGFYYEKESGLKMAALSNSGKIYVGKIGQTLGGKYEVLDIADDHVILKVIYDEEKTIRIPLGKAPGAFIDWTKEQEE